MAKKKAKLRVSSENLTAKVYPLMTRAVEDGITLGYQRAFKHTDTPDRETIETALFDAIMNEICEWFDFGDLQGEE